jgi:hypothetical protein
MRPYAPLCGRTKSLNICTASMESRVLYKNLLGAAAPPIEPNAAPAKIDQSQCVIREWINLPSSTDLRC